MWICMQDTGLPFRLFFSSNAGDPILFSVIYLKEPNERIDYSVVIHISTNRVRGY